MMNKKDNAKIWLGLTWLLIAVLVVIVWSSSSAKQAENLVNQSVEQVSGVNGSDLQGGTVSGSDLQGGSGQVETGGTASLLQGVQ